MFFKILCLRRKNTLGTRTNDTCSPAKLRISSVRTFGGVLSQFASRFRWDVAAAEALAFTVGDLRGVALWLRIRTLKALHIACAS